MGARKQKPQRYQEPRESAEARGRANAIVWRAWPFMAWGLPVALFLVVLLLGTGGWEMVIAMLLSPVLLPALAFTALLPRIIMKRSAGLRSSKTLISVLLIVQWWGTVLFALSVRGVGDSGSTASVLGSVFFSIREPLEQLLMGLGIVLVLVSYLTVLVLAANLPKPRDGEPVIEPSSVTRSQGRWSIVGAAVLVPAVLIGVTVAGVGVGDATHDRVAAEQEHLWNDMQEQLSFMRDVIAADPWYVSGGGALDDGKDAYRMNIGWILELDLAPEEVAERAVNAAGSSGWQLERQPVTEIEALDAANAGSVPGSLQQFLATTDDGCEIIVTIDQAVNGEQTEEGPEAPSAEQPSDATTDANEASESNTAATRIELSMTSPPKPVARDLWIDWRERVPSEEQSVNLDHRSEQRHGPARAFDPDEWPSLAKVSTTTFF